MASKKQRPSEVKEQLHSRNKHRNRYNFPELINSSPALADFVSENRFGDLSVDFKDPEAVESLNEALLSHFYGISLWTIPEGYLCPPVPGRADHIHYLADLLAGPDGTIPRGNEVRVLDIGTGANCIYPLIGNSEYGWRFVGSEIDPFAIQSANNIIEANSLSEVISIRRQSSPASIFEGIVQPDEHFALAMCNPPFHSSMLDATEGTKRKWRNLGHRQSSAHLNFGGQNSELWCKGGELAFVTQMITESVKFSDSFLWFSSLISKKETLHSCLYELKQAGAADIRTIEMAQGQKVSRTLAWTFRNFPVS